MLIKKIKYMRIAALTTILLTMFNAPLKFSPPADAVLQRNMESALEKIWVDSVYNSLSDEQRLGQLFVMRAYSNKGADHEREISNLIEKKHIGGLIFFQGTPEKQAELTNTFQAKSKVPLLIAMDAEWGLGMRMKKQTISFPKQLTLGAIQQNKLVYDFGAEVARQCKRLGVHINFAPVIDINNNPDNPVINDRSFGEDRFNVTAKGYMYTRGLQDNQVMACAKHFPGHGDTDTDSHYDLPVIKHELNRLDSVELYPFKVLAKTGLASMMMAHLSIPALDDRPNRPSSLSENVIKNLLVDKFGFSGLVFTDGLDMAGVTKFFKNGQAEVEALKAGNDVLLLPPNIDAAITAIQAAIAAGELTTLEIRSKVRKILRAKYRYGLQDRSIIKTSNIRAELNNSQAIVLQEKLYEKAITIVRNPTEIVPIRNVDTLSIATLAIGSTTKTPFQKILDHYATMQHFQSGKEVSQNLFNLLKKKELVIIGLHNMSRSSKKNFGVSQSAIDFLNKLSKETKVVLAVFGNPYSLKYFDEIDHLIECYEDVKVVQEKCAQVIFGALGATGRLPVSASARSPYGAGVDTEDLLRLQYDRPEAAGLVAAKLNMIDDIAKEAIRLKATPGCQVLVVKNRKVVFQRSYGYHTYAKRTTVKDSDLYDLASVTKIAATTLSMMDLEEKNQIGLDQPIGEYLSELKGTNKENMLLRDVLAHASGLAAWLPFYAETVTKKHKKPMTEFYKKTSSDEFGIPVARNLYMKTSHVDTVWKRIIESDLRSNTNYRYSDLGFYLSSRLIERKTQQKLDTYVGERFYKPLGLKTLTFNPLNKFPKSRLVPSEKDDYFRHQTVHGYVHDMGAAMLGGVSGHAGLFGDSEDLAVVMQMLLNKGEYGGHRFLKPETIDRFTARHERTTRRGIGFDMQELNKAKDPNISTYASENTFGHTGFTGIGVWADPDNDIIFIFVSNRTFPSMNNWKLNKHDIRLRIHDAIYMARE